MGDKVTFDGVELFKDDDGNSKTFDSIIKEMYESNRKRDNTIGTVSSHIVKMLEGFLDDDDINSAAVVSSVVKDLLDAGIKNDEKLVKMSDVIQKMVNKVKKLDGGDSDKIPVSDLEELKELLERSGEI